MVNIMAALQADLSTFKQPTFGCLLKEDLLSQNAAGVSAYACSILACRWARDKIEEIRWVKWVTHKSSKNRAQKLTNRASPSGSPNPSPCFPFLKPGTSTSEIRWICYVLFRTMSSGNYCSILGYNNVEKVKNSSNACPTQSITFFERLFTSFPFCTSYPSAHYLQVSS